VQELDHALIILIQNEQYMHFQNDVTLLKNSQPIKKNSSLRSLNPYIDEFGMLRVFGRLENSPFSKDKKRPVILSAKSRLSRLLFEDVHLKYFHANRTFLHSFFNSRYWFIGGCTNLIKFVIRNCIDCRRSKATNLNQLMGQLPADRVTISRPFSSCAVDFAGPFTVKCIIGHAYTTYSTWQSSFVGSLELSTLRWSPILLHRSSKMP